MTAKDHNRSPHNALQTDDAVYRRFSESNTAFNALSRHWGHDWQDIMRRRRTELAAEGKAAPGRLLESPEEALFQYAYAEGFDRMNVLTANWGSGKSNRGALLWEPPLDLPEEMLAHRPTDPDELTEQVRWVANRCGAALTGIAPFDARWIYSDVQRNHCSPETPIRKPIEIRDAAHPHETDEALVIPTDMQRVVVMAVPMDREMIATAPSLLSEAATSLGYSDAARATLSVAAYIRALGYQAIPSLNGTGLNIPLAVAAGLGEAGRNGLLITAEYGSCVRLAKVFTDMPLISDEPVDLGIQTYCETCGACARQCPAQAIADERSWIGNNECNNDGAFKWAIDAQKCLRYWTISGTSCSACIANCPFSLGKDWWAGIPQRIIRHTPIFNRLFAWLDERFADRKRISSQRFSAAHHA